MRIVGGTLRGRGLAAPGHQGLRPTADRVRESLFNILAHGVDDFSLEGARVVDLFAGTGALGLEALSRGAAYALFVDTDADARALIRRNVEAFGLTGVTKIWRRDATDLGPAGTMTAFDLALIDPPYDHGLAPRALASLTAGGWLAAGAIVVLEDRKGTALEMPRGIEVLETRNYGDTDITIGRHAP